MFEKSRSVKNGFALVDCTFGILLSLDFYSGLKVNISMAQYINIIERDCIKINNTMVPQ